MAKQIINIGTNPNDGTGDTIRTVGGKINTNFTELYTGLGNGTALDSALAPFTTVEKTKLSLIESGATANLGALADLDEVGTTQILDNSVTALKLETTTVIAGTYNLATITVDAQGRITFAANGSLLDSNIVPSSDGLIDLGSETFRFGTLHVDTIDLNGTTLDGQSTLTDPNTYSLMGWNDSSNAVDWFTVGTGLTLTGTTISTDVTLGANTFTGAQNFGGQLIESYLNKVISDVSGVLTDSGHSGNILITAGNITIPKIDGFTCILVSGGIHTVTFNALTSSAMAAGDLMTVLVEDSDTIHAVRIAAADKVSFA